MREMIRVLIELRGNEATSSSVVVQARSVREAASMTAAVYPSAEVRVKFPIDPEAFFVKEPAAREEIVSVERVGRDGSMSQPGRRRSIECRNERRVCRGRSYKDERWEGGLIGAEQAKL